MAAGAGLLALLWAAAMFCCSRDVGVFATRQAKLIVPVLPLYLIVSYGAYSLASIGWALVVFNDVPHEAVLLEKVCVDALCCCAPGRENSSRRIPDVISVAALQEIEQAKSDLARRGMKL